MRYSNPEQLCFPPAAGQTLRADFEGGALSSDFGALLLRGIDRQMGLTERLAAALHDKRHPSYIDHPLRDLLAQRIYQLAAGYADANDANHLRHDPVFKLGVERCPLDPARDLASAPTFAARAPNRPHRPLATHTRLGRSLASYAEPPAAIVLDLDHSDDPTYGQQELAFYNHHSQNHCYLPLFIFEGTSHALVTAFLASGHPPAWGRKCDDRGPAVVVSPAPLADVITAGPLAAGSPSGCWHPPRMHDLIQRRFGGSYHPHSLAPLLHHLGFSSQKARLVSEHLNEAKRLEWRRCPWPRILRHAQQRKALLLLGAEARCAQWGSLSDPWAPTGAQPAVPTSGKRKGYKVFGLIDYFSGQGCYNTHEGRLHSASSAAFVLDVLAQTQRHGIVMHDGARAHTRHAMQPFVKAQAARWTMEPWPSYSPDCNPSEPLGKKVKKEATHVQYVPDFAQ